MPPLEDASDNDVEYPAEGKLLVIRQALNVQVNKDDLMQQRETIFHKRCHISNKVYGVIIDGWRYANVVALHLSVS